MIEECVIVGGGVAGLSALNQLTDFGLSPLMIDANEYPAHRLCGEFFSYESLPILDRWGIPLSCPITQCRFFRGDRKVEFKLPSPSLSASRYEFDTKLLERGKMKGGRVMTSTKVISLKTPKRSSESFELILSNGQTVRASHLIVGTGKIPGLTEKSLPLQYVGLKAYFEGILMDNCIEMHTFDGGYVGLSGIGPKTTNIACLLKKKYFDSLNLTTPEAFLPLVQEEKLMSSFKKRILGAHMVFPQWLFGQIPEFGVRENPCWERVFWIGDAAGSIPPISGDGLAMAITSGCMAGDFFLKKKTAREFKEAWKKRYKRRFFVGKLLHQAALSHQMSRLTIDLCRVFPNLPLQFWKWTRE